METRKLSLDGKWSLALAENKRFRDEKPDVSTIAAVKLAGYQTVEADVPGNFERDLERAGLIEDPYFGSNVLKLQKLENLHLIYYRTFEYTGAGKADGGETVLRFEGIDTIADIYVNGVKIGSTDNMLVPFEFSGANIREGRNEIVVHITPAHIAARSFPVPVSSHAGKYNYDSLYIRKAPHMYAWDIMPRILTGGIWRPVSVENRPADRVDDVFLYVQNLDTAKKTANITLFYNLTVDGDDLEEYSLAADGVCGDSRFHAETGRLWHTAGKLGAYIGNCKFWWPRNYGDPNLYDVTVTLSRAGKPVYVYTMKAGVRTVRLDRTSTTDESGKGEFCFYINGRKVFVLGSNWVPVDAFHANDAKRLPEILPMLNDIGCNAVRCWGGNVYEDDIFYNFCDANGIMVWQDFALACAINPQDEYFRKLFGKEVEKVILRLRGHASLILWAGDNEVDACYQWSGSELRRDPNKNFLTRQVIPDMLLVHDFTRPYLPSSPYIDEYAFKTREPTSEEHCWGPRDYFKGSYYKKTVCHFASETGYHGCPSPASLKKFISADQLWHWKEHPDDKYARPDWLVHAACAETGGKDGCAYRIPLMSNQVITLFGSEPDTLDDFAVASQISQAEAKKYFIERFRVTKWRRTGIIWWNLIDGWPQISDAVVDYYGCKKLAYHYIKRSQQPVCLIFDEPTPDGSRLPLYAVNDTSADALLQYTVTDVLTGETLAASECLAKADASVPVWYKPLAAGEQRFILVEWEFSDGEKRISGKNHFMAGMPKISLADYVAAMKKCGFYGEFEGF